MDEVTNTEHVAFTKEETLKKHPTEYLAKDLRA